MKKLTLILIAMLLIGCITSKTKIKLTDTKTGNSVTITDQGLALDIQALEKDGFKVEIVESEENKDY